MEKLIYLEEHFAELFVDLHASGLFADGKEIADAITQRDPAEILAAYRSQKDDKDFDLTSFYQQHFQKAPSREINYQSDTTKPVQDHIEKLWDILARLPQKADYHSSRIELPFPYIVPGGRFNEIYYWDSFFTMLGLAVSGRIDMIEDMVKNFDYMIHSFGFIPNGNRSYYLGRSQPPFFSLMVALLAEQKGENTLATYTLALEKEYSFWMEGVDRLSDTDQAHKRVVRLRNGDVLNRYYDNIHAPRAEMYQDDVELIASQGEKGKQTLVNIRAACESGWDFSSRWCEDPADLATIRTTDLVQIDLNCLLYHLEMILYKATGLENYALAAQKRKDAIQKHLWNETLGTYSDLLWRDMTHSPSIHAGALFPLYFNLATPAQAEQAAQLSSKELLKAGGLLTSNYDSGQQWDAPNGWAPLQWMAIKGLRNYGHTGLADEIKTRWTQLNIKVFKQTGKLMEKYNVVDINLESGGGEYPVQDGFGWTNGVLLALLNE